MTMLLGLIVLNFQNNSMITALALDELPLIQTTQRELKSIELIFEKCLIVQGSPTFVG